MKTSEAIEFYGGSISALARALGLNQSTPYSWGEYPPIGRQYQLQELSGGLLRVTPQQAKARNDEHKARA